MNRVLRLYDSTPGEAIKAAKPKVVTTAATTTTTTRPKDKGVVVQEPSEFRVPQEIKPSSSIDKGKGYYDLRPDSSLTNRKEGIKLERKSAKVAERRCLEENEQESTAESSITEGMLVHYELIRAYGSSKRYSSMIRMLQGIDREDLEALWRIVKAIDIGDTRLE
ncbi:hypothetical protein Tco_0202051 [Tanacetum coccineum]